MEEGQQQKCLRQADGRHHEDVEDEDDFLKRQADFSNIQTDKHILVLVCFFPPFGFGCSVSLKGYVKRYDLTLLIYFNLNTTILMTQRLVSH